MNTIKKRAVEKQDLLIHDEADEALRTGEESRWNALQPLMRRVSLLIDKLTSMQVAQSWVNQIDNKLDALVMRASATPTLDLGKGIADLEKAHEKLVTVLCESTIPANHQLRKLEKDIAGRILDLISEKGDAGGVEEKFHSHGKNANLNAYRTDRINLPKFDGSLEQWVHFWAQFEESVHNNTMLTKTQKLGYLRQSMANQAVKNLLLPPTSSPDIYDKLIIMLQDRYNKPRKLHELYCERLATLPACAEDLLAGGDRLQVLVDGILALGLTDINSIATSLGVATLPTTLQSEWNTQTKGQKGVPQYP